jgi:hypothetical protein
LVIEERHFPQQVFRDGTRQTRRHGFEDREGQPFEFGDVKE